MDYLQHLIDSILHIDVYLNTFVSVYGFWTYFVLFAIIFCETGLVITPFLPGDSLLFAAGSIAAQPDNSLSILILFLLLLIASIAGNQVNFLIGKMIGTKLLTSKHTWIINKNHLQKTQEFYEKHGGKTIVFARFIPIIRSFAPFVAGLGRMQLKLFSRYNILSGVLWIGSLLGLGYFLGSLTIVQKYFSVIIYGIVFVSLLPPIITLFAQRQKHL